MHVSHQCLYIGFNNIEIKFDEYDVLCLRPTPAPLSILARCYIRELLAHSNERVERINESGKRRRLPENLVQFLKERIFVKKLLNFLLLLVFKLVKDGIKDFWIVILNLEIYLD